MKAVILAGGEGKRLRPITCTVPKPMVKLLNKPTLFYTLELLKKHGFEEQEEYAAQYLTAGRRPSPIRFFPQSVKTGGSCSTGYRSFCPLSARKRLFSKERLLTSCRLRFRQIRSWVA